MALLAVILATLPPCTISQVGPGQYASTATNSGTVILKPFVHNLGRACTLHTRLVMSLRARGRVLDVRGNPATIDFSGRFGSKAFRQATFIWRNWCGSKRAQVWLVMRGLGGYTSMGSDLPRCVDRTRPSTLTRRD